MWKCQSFTISGLLDEQSMSRGSSVQSTNVCEDMY